MTRTGRRLLAAPVWVPWLTAAAVATLYTAVAVRRHQNLETGGFDLGIFTQDVASWAHLRVPPVSTLKGPDFNRFGDHVSPILAVLGPVYRLFPSAVTLLVAQAVLLAVGVVPLMRFAHRRLGSTPAMLVVGLAFGLSWGIANAADFDFHEIAFAVPLLVMSSIAYVERRDVAAVAWAAPLVLVKEDLGLTLAVLGVLVAVRGRRRLGVLTALGGLLASAVEVLVIIPAANPGGRADKIGYFGATFGHALTSWPPDARFVTLLWLLAPTAFLALRSPVTWLAAPTLLWRFASDHEPFWGTAYHYSAVLMPVVFVAFVEVLGRFRGPRWWPLAVSAAVTVALVPFQSLDEALHAPLWRTTVDTAAIHRLLDRVPPDVTVAASNDLAAQLVARDDVSLVGRTTLDADGPLYAVVDVRRSQFPLVGAAAAQAIVDRALDDGYREVAEAGGVVLLTRAVTVS